MIRRIPRTGETDQTVVVLVGLVLVLLLFVGGLGGMLAWQWKRTEQARRLAEAAEAREQEMAARSELERVRAEVAAIRFPPPPPPPDPWVIESAREASRLFGAPVMGPWPLVPLLHPEPPPPLPGGLLPELLP